MKRLLILLFAIFAFTGCIYDDTEENLSTEGSIFPKGTPFKTYTTVEKEEILEKVNDYIKEEGKLPRPRYPKLNDEYFKLMEILTQESRNGNDEADIEWKEWNELDKKYRGFKRKGEKKSRIY